MQPDLLEALASPKGDGIRDRFWKYVAVRGDDECWDWIGSTRDTGYGQLSVCRFPHKAHRVSFAIHFGWLPPAVLHKCDTPLCVNPRHLFGGSQVDNMRDCAAKGRLRNQLTEAQRSTIETLWELGLTHRAIARQTGASKTTVTRVIARHRYRMDVTVDTQLL